jgi:hypothetical protein
VTCPKFEGHTERECGEHRTTGERAWCHECSEWCYSGFPCRGCELPTLQATLSGYKKVVETAREVKEAFDPEDYDDLFSPPARLDAYERLVAALAALDKEKG